MDLLTDVLKQAGLQRRQLQHLSSKTNWRSLFPCEKSFGFHVITQGPIFLHIKNKKPIELHTGDVALMARGVHHILSSKDKVSPKDWHANLNVRNSEAAGEEISIVSGVYQFWNQPIHPFFQEIPTWSIIRSNEIPTHDPIRKSLELLSLENSSGQFGNQIITLAILDMLFSYILRKVIQDQTESKTSWSLAVKDQQLNKALRLLHEKPSHPWNLDNLAQESGISRSSLAAKFKKKLGDSPLHYLNTIRIQKAMELLTNTDLSIESIATELGFSDAFVFSKSFKKRTLVSPREFRKKSLGDESVNFKIN